MARYGEDGNLEYLGRIDQQVKVRGFRVELGEIEAVLQQHGGVSECAVLAVEKEAGEKQLVAYVVAVEDSGQQRVTAVPAREIAGVHAARSFCDAGAVAVDGQRETGSGRVAGSGREPGGAGGAI